jgi:glycosyltransferase involved in cell wall biosynthesis
VSGSVPTVSVIVSSYDHPTALGLVLEGLRAQDFGPFELLIADDGSGADTLELVDQFRSEGLAIEFVAQADEGFRKAMAVNRAVRKSSGDQLIFLDGDCVPFPDLLSRHVDAYRPHSYAVGGYVWTDLPTARGLSREDVAAGRHMQLLDARARARLWSVHVRNVFYGFLGKPRKPKILGGNFSVARDAMWAVNGFDEGFDGYSGEDSDIRTRLNNLGATGISLWNRAFVCHLDHGLDPPRCRPEVVRRRGERALLLSNRSLVRTPRGLE